MNYLVEYSVIRAGQWLHPLHLWRLVQQLALGIGDRERSLCLEPLSRQNLNKCNNHRHQRNKYLTVAGQCYTPFRLPKTC